MTAGAVRRRCAWRSRRRRRWRSLDGRLFKRTGGIRQEQRKFQGLTATAEAHINCEPLRDDDDPAFVRMTAKEIGDVTLLARVTDHAQGLATPALYGVEVTTILSARRITHLRSYLGAYTGTFRAHARPLGAVAGVHERHRPRTRAPPERSGLLRGVVLR
ncbi:hypothetical protein ACFW9V_12225 [Streptomyces hygroscopicus]|uniref:hypothetical protein n=1 Tax=Streptomyces hygroscopicus TaxID=1912 RepID=UPI0036861CBD